jgi:hypothetical protein
MGSEVRLWIVGRVSVVSIRQPRCRTSVIETALCGSRQDLYLGARKDQSITCNEVRVNATVGSLTSHEAQETGAPKSAHQRISYKGRTSTWSSFVSVFAQGRLFSSSIVVDTNRQGRQSSILVDITVSIYIDLCRDCLSPLYKSFPNLYRLLMLRY